MEVARVTRLLTVGFLALIVSAGLAGAAAPANATIDLTKEFSRAVVRTPVPSHVTTGDFEVAGEKRPGIFMHPESSAEFSSFLVTDDSVLAFSVGILTSAWTEPGDGVEFQVTLKIDGERDVNLFSRYIDPKHIADERKWLPVEIRLWPFAGKRARITLGTLSGPRKNTEFDWSVWAEPRVESGVTR